MQWVKPDGNPEQMQRDAADCRDAAWRETSRYWWGSPWYGGYAPWYPAPYGYGFVRPRPFGAGPGGFYTDRFYEEERLAQFCMRAKGYQLVPTERPAAE